MTPTRSQNRPKTALFSRLDVPRERNNLAVHTNVITMNHTVFGLDVGHGHVKGIFSPRTNVAREIFFPSYAVPTAADNIAESCITQGRKIMIAPTDSSPFYVGEDIEMFIDNKDERALDEGYALSDCHLALVRGALSRTLRPVIDMLVVGLPMNTISSVAARLREKLRGTHPVPSFVDASTGTTINKVEVKNVEVLAQPLGAVISAVQHNPKLAKARIATLDWGYNTFDALASTGVTPLPRRSGAVQGGMAAYIEEIQKSVEKTAREKVPSLKGQYRTPVYLYEEALRSENDEITLSIGEIKISEHLASANARAERDVEKIFSVIGSPADMGAVVLAGGGAPLITPILKRNYPEILNIVIPKRPQFSIAEGYLLFGQTLMAQRHERHA